jgi:transcriptional regulator with XRE-family HTH domain
MNTGSIIRRLRKEKRLSQNDLAKLLHVSQATVTSWETGKADPSSSALNALANCFNVSTDYLLGRTDKRQSAENEPDHVDIARDPVVLSFNGQPISQDDLDIIKAVLRRHDEK